MRETGASLGTRWERIHMPLQETRVPSLVQEDPTSPGAMKPASQLLSLCFRAWKAQLLCAPTTMPLHLEHVSTMKEATAISPRGFPGGTRGKEPDCQCRRLKKHRFDPWVQTIPWRMAWQPIPVSLYGESPWTEEPGGP